MTHEPSESGVAAQELTRFVERIEALDEEHREINDARKNVYAEARGRGFDTKAIRKLVAIRREGLVEYREGEAILELYLQAMGMA